MTGDLARLVLFLCVADLVNLRSCRGISDLHRAATDKRAAASACT